MGVKINNFILNTDFTNEKVITPSPRTITVSISSGRKANKTILGYADLTVPSGKYMITGVHSNSNNNTKYAGIYGDYLTGNSDGGPSYPYWVFGELVQTSNTNIRLRVWGFSAGGYNFTIPAFTATVKVSLSMLPIDF
jgi:hypothetical protein